MEEGAEPAYSGIFFSGEVFEAKNLEVYLKRVDNAFRENAESAS